jgi:hypothetical protein
MDSCPPHGKDANGFAFRELNRVQPATAELAAAVPPIGATSELDGYFAFADYLD